MHIGKGYIGDEGFKYLLNHPELQKIPYILETPKETLEDDIWNISLVKKMKE